MPSFARASTQAARAVQKANAIGTARHDAGGDGRIHGHGTARNYEQSLKLAGEWGQAHGAATLAEWKMDQAIAYLEERAEAVSQKTLDMDRQALQVLPHIETLPRIQTELGPEDLAGRAYTEAQVEAIAEAQVEHNRLATEIAHGAGLRAHELYTLAPVAEQPASTHREWSDDRFDGREGEIYTVVGKGGLVREVCLPRELAERLEEARLDEPKDVVDRGIEYQTRYDIGGGNAWSASFTRASERELGYSTGAHGLRHSYAQERVDELQGRGFRYPDALATVSQEMGHFRPDITEVYLR